MNSCNGSTPCGNIYCTLREHFPAPPQNTLQQNPLVHLLSAINVAPSQIEEDFKAGDFLFWDGPTSSYEIIYHVMAVYPSMYLLEIVTTYPETPYHSDGEEAFVYKSSMRDHTVKIEPAGLSATQNKSLCRCPIFDIMNLGCKCGGE